jgi:integrase
MFRSKLEVASSHVTTKYLQARLTAVTAALGFEKWRITVHSFRASGAIAAIYAGLPIDLVMYRAGWSSPDMMDYYTYLRQILNLPELTATARSGDPSMHDSVL